MDGQKSPILSNHGGFYEAHFGNENARRLTGFGS